jgi:hypothetical protein
MAKRHGFIVSALHRVSIASILKIESVPEPGECRWLQLGEIESLYDGLLLGPLNSTEVPEQPELDQINCDDCPSVRI